MFNLLTLTATWLPEISDAPTRLASDEVFSSATTHHQAHRTTCTYCCQTQ